MYVQETERDLKKHHMIAATLTSVLLIPILLTLLLCAHLPNISYSLRFVPIFVLIVLVSCVLCIFNVYRIATRRDQDDDRTTLHLFVLSCLNFTLLSLVIAAVLFIILKLDKVIDWEWSVVFVPIWILDSLFVCVDIVIISQIVIAMRGEDDNRTRVEYVGRLAAFVFLLNVLVIPGIVSEMLVTIEDLRAIIQVSPLIASYAIILLVVVIDRVISVMIWFERLLLKWDTRSKLREKMKTERSLHSVMNRENVPISFSIVDVYDHEEKEHKDDDDLKEEEDETRHVESKVEALRDGNLANFNKMLQSFRSASTEQDLLSLIEKMSSCISKSTPACRVRMRRSLLDLVRHNKKMVSSKAWTERVRDNFADLLREATPLFSFMRILMDEISLTNNY